MTHQQPLKELGPVIRPTGNGVECGKRKEAVVEATGLFRRHTWKALSHRAHALVPMRFGVAGGAAEHIVDRDISRVDEIDAGVETRHDPFEVRRYLVARVIRAGTFVRRSSRIDAVVANV